MDRANYIEKCTFKKNYHYINAKKSRMYNTFIDVLGILLTASAGLCLTVLTVTGNDVLTVTVVQAVFLFSITINSKIKGSMNFVSLMHRHLGAGDEFSTLCNEFQNTSQDDSIYPYLVSKYILTSQKLHIQEIRCCFNIEDNSSIHGSG